MKFTIATIAFASQLFSTAFAANFPFDRLDKNEAALLVVDHQVGLFKLVQDFSPVVFRNNILAHAAVGKVFNLPTILTSSAETGPNGPLPKEITDMHPNAPLIKRNGEVDAWDNPEFRAAVEATGKKQIILGGVTTDVCTVFLALSLRAAGYDVWANHEASGTFDEKVATAANDRMRDAGVHLVSTFAVVTDLMRDWRHVPGAAEIIPYFDEYLPSYGYLARAHGGAVENGTLIPGEAALL